jgi:hypothetical protein
MSETNNEKKTPNKEVLKDAQEKVRQIMQMAFDMEASQHVRRFAGIEDEYISSKISLTLNADYLLKVGKLVTGFQYLETSLSSLIRARYPGIPPKVSKKFKVHDKIALIGEFEDDSVVKFLKAAQALRNKFIHSIKVDETISKGEIDKLEILAKIAFPDSSEKIIEFNHSDDCARYSIICLKAAAALRIKVLTWRVYREMIASSLLAIRKNGEDLMEASDKLGYKNTTKALIKELDICFPQLKSSKSLKNLEVRNDPKKNRNIV